MDAKTAVHTQGFKQHTQNSIYKFSSQAKSQFVNLLLMYWIDVLKKAYTNHRLFNDKHILANTLLMIIRIIIIIKPESKLTFTI